MSNGSGVKKEVTKLQNKLIHSVEEEVELRPSYFLLLTFSAIIAALGLLTNSTAIVIGAMLISPLFWPIMGVTLSLFRNRQKITGRSLLLLGYSIVIVIATGAIVGWIAPIEELSQEILLRTQPTIVDLIIALTTSVIAVMATFYPRISSTATGVAISIALLPPLTVSGIGIAFGSWTMFSRAFLLFSTNVVAMIFAGMLTLYFLNFRPRRKKEETRMRIGFISSFVTLVILAIPLSIYFKNTLDSDQVQLMVQNTLQQEIAEISNDAHIEDIQVEYIPTLDEEIAVQGTLYLPEGTYITEVDQSHLIDAIAEQVGRTINLQLDVVNTVEIRQVEDEQFTQLRKNIELALEQKVFTINPNAYIEDISISNVEQTATDIALSLRQRDVVPLTFDQKEDIAEQLSNQFNKEISLEVILIPVEQLAQPDKTLKLETSAENVLVQDMATINQAIAVENVTIEDNTDNKTTYTVQAHVYVPSETTILVSDRDNIQQHLSTELDAPVELVLRIFTFQAPQEPQPDPETEQEPAI